MDVLLDKLRWRDLLVNLLLGKLRWRDLLMDLLLGDMLRDLVLRNLWLMVEMMLLRWKESLMLRK